MSTPLAAGLLLLLAAGVAIWYEGRRHGRDDNEALAEATREGVPDYVPDEWVKEFRK